MAKQEEIDLRPWERFDHAAARVVRTRTAELFELGENVLDTGDIERVHDMRVATRRLRAVMEIFAACFPPAEFKSCLRDVKRLADALGERRDPDVHIDAMVAFAAAMPPAQRPGVESLVAALRDQQARGNINLAIELQQIEESDLHDRLLALADAAAPA